MYDITDLGTFSSLPFTAQLGQLRASDINDAGEVCGIAPGSDTDPSALYGFRWSAAAGTVFLTGARAEVNRDASINASGQIALTLNHPTLGSAPVIWFGDTLHELPTAAGQGGVATGINSAGDVVGFVLSPSGSIACLWRAGQPIQLLAGLGSEATGINDSGLVVGSAPFGSATHAFAWTAAGGLQDLGAPAGAQKSGATAVNGPGQIVGASEQGPFLWTPSAGMKLLADDGLIIPFDINDSGEIVGYNYPTVNRAWYASAGGLMNLNALIEADSGWLLYTALAINNNHQIVGAGALADFLHLYLLNPIPVVSPGRGGQGDICARLFAEAQQFRADLVSRERLVSGWGRDPRDDGTVKELEAEIVRLGIEMERYGCPPTPIIGTGGTLPKLP